MNYVRHLRVPNHSSAPATTGRHGRTSHRYRARSASPLLSRIGELAVLASVLIPVVLVFLGVARALVMAAKRASHRQATSPAT